MHNNLYNNWLVVGPLVDIYKNLEATQFYSKITIKNSDNYNVCY